MVQGLANGLGDFAAYPVGFEAVDLEFEVREGGFDGVKDVGFEAGLEEMELNVFRASGVLENGENGSHGSPDVVGVECHGNVDPFWLARVTVAKGKGFPEGQGF